MQKENTPSSEKSQEIDPVFCIRLGQVYTTQQVIAALKTSRETIDKWCGMGLKRSQRGTKSVYYLGDHLIKFLFEEDTEV